MMQEFKIFEGIPVLVTLWGVYHVILDGTAGFESP
jgi:hypothetical protein